MSDPRRHRLAARLKAHGVAVDDEMLGWMVEQEAAGACHICGGRDEGRALCLDAVGDRLRGWLCDRCNRALGGFRDDPELLLRARDYVLRASVAHDLAEVARVVEVAA